MINMANYTYVMSDLHGHFNKFINMLRKINFDSTDKMMILGNVVSGGPQPIDLLVFISQQENIKMALGLHEIIMMRSILNKDIEMFNEWTNNQDGRLTYDSFSRLAEDKQHYILNYLKESCPSFFIVGDFVLSNMGMNIWEDDQKTDLTTERPTLKEIMDRDQHSEKNILVVNENFYQKAGLKDKIIVFGSTPVQVIRQNKNYHIWKDPIYKDKICINSGIGIEPHKLCCLRLEGLKEYYI